MQYNKILKKKLSHKNNERKKSLSAACSVNGSYSSKLVLFFEGYN